jgi:anaerobic magnesium-protoporphyrin IX monomethyl ester cyclase
VKIILCTTPIRPVPTDYPPFGSLAIIQALRNAAYDPVFLDIDGLRPSFEDVIARFRREAPDVVGISAVVSTAYAYVKRLCLALRKALPGVRIVLGGNLAASAELLHRLCGVDLCVVGEGERVIVNVVRYFERCREGTDWTGLARIKGITYLDRDGTLVFTGYDDPIPPHEFLDPDFAVLEQWSNIANYVTDPFARTDFAQDRRSREPHRTGKTMSTVLFTKGCVARCTFCHRWDRGFRQISPATVIGRIHYLMDRYNVGFIQFGDENFGSDRRATDELIRLIKPLDVLWKVAGVRARSIDLDLLKRMRDAGCVALYYGFETGSPDILKVMEKNLDLSHNYNAARWTSEAELFTIYQLVVGMPGENARTIGETIEMAKTVTEFLPEPPQKYLSINYVQALPGTPVYEYGRVRGIIGPRLEDEEAYLLRISDVDPANVEKIVNYTDSTHLAMRTWAPRILVEAICHWYRVRRHRRRSATPDLPADRYDKGGYFNLYDIRFDPRLLTILYPVRGVAIWVWTLWSEFRHTPAPVFWRRVGELVTWPLRRRRSFTDYRSLRQVMREDAPPPRSRSEVGMAPLRAGR